MALLITVLLLVVLLVVLQGVEMATVGTINDKVLAIANDVTRVDALVKDLANRAVNGAATQAEVDKIDSDLDSVRQRLAAVVAPPAPAASAKK